MPWTPHNQNYSMVRPSKSLNLDCSQLTVVKRSSPNGRLFDCVIRSRRGVLRSRENKESERKM